jgi:Integrase core domain
LVVLAHHRRRVLHFNVTEHPTAAWTAQQIVNTFPEDSAPSYLLRDRDTVYGQSFRQRVKGMRIREVLTAPHSPWQSPFVERLIGSARRECLDHVLVLNERHLRRILTRYFAYYHRVRTHLALDKDAPDKRPIELPELGPVLPEACRQARGRALHEGLWARPDSDPDRPRPRVAGKRRWPKQPRPGLAAFRAGPRGALHHQPHRRLSATLTELDQFLNSVEA